MDGVGGLKALGECWCLHHEGGGGFQARGWGPRGDCWELAPEPELGGRDGTRLSSLSVNTAGPGLSIASENNISQFDDRYRGKTKTWQVQVRTGKV